MRWTRDGRKKGFTLIELLVVLIIAGLIFASLVGIYTSTFRHQAQSHYKTLLGNQATLMLTALERQLAQATTILAPLPGQAGDVLSIGKNVRPDNGLAMDTSGTATRSYAYFCRSGGDVWMHADASWPPGSITCGSTGSPVKLMSYARICSTCPFTTLFDHSTSHARIGVHFEVYRDSTSAQESVHFPVSAAIGMLVVK